MKKDIRYYKIEIFIIIDILIRPSQSIASLASYVVGWPGKVFLVQISFVSRTRAGSTKATEQNVRHKALLKQTLVV